MISQTFIRELLDRADIFELINKRVPLQVKGANGWACCPFHHEKSPSFSVNREKQMFHCFGCGEHGNAISFLMKFENLPFPDAVEKLAQESGVKVVYEGGSAPRRKETPRLTDIMQRAQAYYRRRFAENAAAQKYVTERGLSPETIEKFGIGFAPNGWQNLDSEFSAADMPLLKEAGLRKDGTNGSSYDFFRNRLMFPIKNIRGQIIAFSARTMSGEEPKYINTGDTPLFTKGKEVFGLFEARKSIHDKKRVIVVEGQMDVIQMSQAGFGETCAPLGTAIRSDHVERLLKQTDQIIFSFDGDAAGRKAALRAMDISLPLLSEGQKALFVFLPEGEDPDSLIKNQGAKAYENLIEKALPLSSYLIDALSADLDLGVLEDRAAFIENAAPYIKKTKSKLLREGLIERISTVAGYSDSAQLFRYFGFEKTLPPKIKVPSQWQGRFKNASQRPMTSRRSLPPKSDTPLAVLLRNFLRFPQLALEFEGSATEHLGQGSLGSADKIFRVIGKISEEDDQGISLINYFEKLPPAESDDFEIQMEPIRNQLAILLLEDGNDPEITQASSRGQELQTPISLARFETKRIFLQIEFDKNEQQRKQICDGNLTEENRQKYQALVIAGKRLKEEIRMIDQKINDDLTRRTR